MLSKKTCLAFFLFFSLKSFAQGSIISDSLNLKRGFYSSFEEFRDNNPSRPFSYPLYVQREAYGVHKDQQFTSYKLIDSVRLFNKKQAIWGFCDGRFVYIQKPGTNFLDGYVPLPVSGDVSLSKITFVKLLSLGRYCYFEMTEPLLLVPAGSQEVISTQALIGGKIDMNSGKLYRCAKGENLDKVKAYSGEHNEEMQAYRKVELEFKRYLDKEYPKLFKTSTMKAEVTAIAMRGMVTEMLTGLAEIKEETAGQYAYAKAYRFFVDCGKPEDYTEIGQKLWAIKSKYPWMADRHFKN